MKDWKTTACLILATILIGLGFAYAATLLVKMLVTQPVLWILFFISLCVMGVGITIGRMTYEANK